MTEIIKEQKELILFSRVGCTSCIDLKYALEKNGIDFQEFDITTREALKKINELQVKKVVLSLPTTLLIIKGIVKRSYRGFNSKLLEEIISFMSS